MIEDAATGTYLRGGFFLQFNDNNCDKIQCVKIDGVGGVAVTGNHADIGTGGNNFGATVTVEFAGANYKHPVRWYTWQTGPAYKVDAGGTFLNSHFAEDPPDADADAYTNPSLANPVGKQVLRCQHQACRGTLLSTGKWTHIIARLPRHREHVRYVTASAPRGRHDRNNKYWNGYGHGLHLHIRGTLSRPRRSAPRIPTWPLWFQLSQPGRVTTAFTVTLSATLTSGKIFFHCWEQIPNVLTGGVGFTSVWSGIRATLTTLAAATDPNGGSVAAKIIEDGTAANNHSIAENITVAAGTWTYSV